MSIPPPDKKLFSPKQLEIFGQILGDITGKLKEHLPATQVIHIELDGGLKHKLFDDSALLQAVKLECLESGWKEIQQCSCGNLILVP